LLHEHLFAGHGSGDKCDDLTVDDLIKRVKFNVPEGKTAYVHLMSSNRGKI
jgi:hypothetical protein